MIRRPGRLVPALVAALLLAACAAPRTVPDDRASAWADLRERLHAMGQWRAEGRIAISGTAEPGTVHFRWIETGGAGFGVRLEGPWGQNVGRLEVGDGRATLTTREGVQHVGRDPAALLLRLYGWRIPVTALRRWLVGLPGDSEDYALDRFGRLETLHWRAWRIEYRRHRIVDGLDLPADLRARNRRDGTEIRVAVDEWQRGPAGDRAPVDESPIPLIGG